MKTKSKKLTDQELIEKITFLLGDEDLDMNEHDNLFLVLFERFKYASQSKWIDVETPPTDSEYVLGATKSGILCYLVYYQPSFNMWMGYGESQVEERITHWQHLPSNPIQNQ